MWLSHSSSEVNRFHPVCEKALKAALKINGTDKQYAVLHHQYTGALEMDYVIQNKTTGKYLCVIEVKRTPADVHSTRYQFQAMSYVQMNAEQSERPFYILTNLEYAFSFRYDSARSRVYQQILQPGLVQIGNFEQDSETEFVEKLASFFAQQFTAYMENSYEYLQTLHDFARHMEQIKRNPSLWKTHLGVLLYEYIRGAFTFIQRNDLKDVRLFQNNVMRICEEAAQVNFKEIFNYTEDTFDPMIQIDPALLNHLFHFGQQNVSGDLVAGILHSIVSAGEEHNGEVPTDLELGRLVAELAKYSSGDLSPTDLLCDPAAGSGNLISAAIPVYNLNPTQILVNDINSKLLELLSLRIGLNFARTISHSNSPRISSHNISDLDTSFFENVKVILMNPPFVAGINCVSRKLPFYDRIRTLAKAEPESMVGQMPLEAVFLELVLELAKPETTISCVLPKTHLTGRGIESQCIRQLLLNKFGLQLVFTYDGNEIFNDVTMDTCVVVGKVKTSSDSVKVVSSYDKIPDIDIHSFSKSLTQDVSEDFSPIMAGVVAKNISVTTLTESIEDGWRILNSEMQDAITFVNQIFKNSDLFIPLKNGNYPMQRGKAGNSGASDLLFFNSRSDLMDKFKNEPIIFHSGMRNAKLVSLDLGSGDSNFLSTSENSPALLDAIIQEYLQLPDREGKQQRIKKTAAQLHSILSRENKSAFPSNSVLIPRGIRETGKVYVSKNPIFVSTNFVVTSLPSLETAILLSTWMSTIFYQLICEVSSKDQEGMRKMEVSDIEKTYIPVLSHVSTSTRDALRNVYTSIPFLNLKTPAIREVDNIWAKELFGENANEILMKSKTLLQYLAHKRNPVHTSK